MAGPFERVRRRAKIDFIRTCDENAMTDRNFRGMIRSANETCGLTQKEIGALAGRSQATVSGWSEGGALLNLPKEKYRFVMMRKIRNRVKSTLLK
ncbi:MAG: hypothetical protein RLZZ283_762 [Candidatus Parcubacteria bacterium]|jgi:hypothetical protein